MRLTGHQNCFPKSQRASAELSSLPPVALGDKASGPGVLTAGGLASQGTSGSHDLGWGGGEVLLASSRQGPATLLDSPQFTGQAPPQRLPPARGANSAKAEKANGERFRSNSLITDHRGPRRSTRRVNSFGHITRLVT